MKIGPHWCTQNDWPNFHKSWGSNKVATVNFCAVDPKIYQGTVFYFSRRMKYGFRMILITILFPKDLHGQLNQTLIYGRTLLLSNVGLFFVKFTVANSSITLELFLENDKLFVLGRWTILTNYPPQSLYKRWIKNSQLTADISLSLI